MLNGETLSNRLASRANSAGLSDVSMYVWAACCLRFGSGGTEGALNAYDNIMLTVLDELEKPSYEYRDKRQNIS